MSVALQQKEILQEITARQAQASDPSRHVWVMASAGSGKTKVLSDRFIRLMMQGARPESILCITYTRAGAAEMRQRVFDRLGAWVCMGNDALRADLESLNGGSGAINDHDIARARGLFQIILEAGDGLMISTIHGFCQSLLAQFRIEAGMDNGFEVMEEDQTEAALRAIVHDITENTTDPLIRNLVTHMSEGGVMDLVKNISAARHKFKSLNACGLDRDVLLRDYLELPDGCDLSRVQRDLLDRLRPHTSDILRVKPNNLTKPKVYPEEVVPLLSATDLSRAETEHLIGSLFALFTSKSGTVMRDMKNVDEDLHPWFEMTAEMLMRYDRTRRAIMTYDTTRAVCALADAALGAYQEMKHMQGVLDYDDLIHFALRLLEDSSMSAWVRFKLDGGIEHVLLDEAQDTSPATWPVIRALSEEFFAGDGTRPSGARTLFVVGDPKQSIYRFQGVDPDVFVSERARYRTAAQQSQQVLHDVDLTTSFRTAQIVLDVVDQVMKTTDFPTHHQSAHPARAGYIEWHEAIETSAPDASDKPEKITGFAAAHWTCDPVSEDIRSNPHHVLSSAVADRIASILRAGWSVPSRGGRAVRADDMMILLRTRNHLAAPLLSCLIERQIPVAGLDRIRLSRASAVEDLLDMLAWGLDPQDDLTLARLLVSPLIDLGHDVLEPLCMQASERSARILHVLKDSHPHVHHYLTHIISVVRSRAYHEALRIILFGACPAGLSGYQALQRRLGAACGTYLDAFLERAARAEMRDLSTFSFVQSMRDDMRTMKQETDDTSAGVRIMTVHNAKGLEAPFVFLPDSFVRKADMSDGQSILWAETRAGLALPLFAPRDTERADQARMLLQKDIEAQLREYDRQMYVAMTRPRDALFVFGRAPHGAMMDQSWHTRIGDAIRFLGGQSAADTGMMTLGHIPLCTTQADHAEVPRTLAVTAQPVPETLPIILPEEADDAALASSPETPPINAPETARVRGINWHAFLEDALSCDSLPVNPHDALWRQHPDIDPQAGRAVIARLRADPEYGHLFAAHADALPELRFATRHTQAPSFGRIDRLVRAGDDLWIIDFKTHVPARDDDPAWKTYRDQLAGYAAAMAPLAEGRRVRCLLVEILGPRMVHFDIN